MGVSPSSCSQLCQFLLSKQLNAGFECFFSKLLKTLFLTAPFEPNARFKRCVCCHPDGCVPEVTTEPSASLSLLLCSVQRSPDALRGLPGVVCQQIKLAALYFNLQLCRTAKPNVCIVQTAR